MGGNMRIISVTNFSSHGPSCFTTAWSFAWVSTTKPNIPITIRSWEPNHFNLPHLWLIFKTQPFVSLLSSVVFSWLASQSFCFEMLAQWCWFWWRWWCPVLSLTQVLHCFVHWQVLRSALSWKWNVAWYWWLMVGGWWLVVDGWWLMVDGWWLMVDGWWLMVDGWLLMVDGWDGCFEWSEAVSRFKTREN